MTPAVQYFSVLTPPSGSNNQPIVRISGLAGKIQFRWPFFTAIDALWIESRS